MLCQATVWTVTWNAIPGVCGLGLSVPAAKTWVFTKGLTAWNTTEVLRALAGRVAHILHLSKPILDVDGDLVSSWATLRSLLARRSGSVLPNQPHMECLGAGGAGPRAKCECRVAGNDLGCVWEGKMQKHVETWERHGYFYRNFPGLMLRPAGVPVLPASPWEREEVKMSN